MTIGNDEAGRAVRIHLERLIETRMLVEANSGAGKSWALRRILEQTHGKIQHLVIDPEGEFYTLREKYDYVLAGRGGDCPADVRSAALLARRLLELGTSAIMDIYELKHHERIQFVKVFLESLVNAPRELWHPAVVIIDEAHMFAPENAKAESAQAVIDLMTRGRKRGFVGCLATQRPAALNKNASAQCNNKLIGRFSQDVDVKRAADDIGFFRRDDQAILRTLKPGQFYCVGPALSDQVIQVMVGPVETTHPRAGQRAIAAPPPRDKVRAVLAQLADLPKEAEAEAQTIAELRKKVRALELAASKSTMPDPAVTAARESEIRKEAARSVHQQYDQVMLEIAGAVDKIKSALDRSNSLSPFAGTSNWPPPTIAGTAVRSDARSPIVKSDGASLPARTKPVPRPAAAHTHGVTRPQQAILDGLAWLEAIGISRATRNITAFLASASPRSSAFVNNLGALRSLGLIDYPAQGDVCLTDAGRDRANAPAAPATSEHLHAMIYERLPRPQAAILRVLIEAHPQTVSREHLAAAAGASPTSSAYVNNLGALRSLGLIDYPAQGHVVARELLFLG